MMNLKQLAFPDFMGDWGHCKVCSSVAWSFLGNSSIEKQRPELDDDIWFACSNDGCVYSYGESGNGQDIPDWIK